MKISAMAILVCAFATAQVSFAQQSDTPRAPAPSAEPTAVSDADVETFAAIYVDLLETAAKFDTEIKAAETEAQAFEIRDRAEAESIAKVARHGWTPEKFNSVADAIDGDPALTEKAVRLIQAK